MNDKAAPRRVSQNAQEEILRFFTEVLVGPIMSSLPDLVRKSMDPDLTELRRNAESTGGRLGEVEDRLGRIGKDIAFATEGSAEANRSIFQQLVELKTETSDAREQVIRTVDGRHEQTTASLRKLNDQTEALAAQVALVPHETGRITGADSKALLDAVARLQAKIEQDLRLLGTAASLQAVDAQVNALTARIADVPKEMSKLAGDETKAVLDAVARLQTTIQQESSALRVASESRDAASSGRMSQLETELTALRAAGRRSNTIMFAVMGTVLLVAVTELCVRLFG